VTRRHQFQIDPLGWGVVLLAVLVWEGLVRSGILHFEYLPAPSTVLGGFGDLLASGALLADVAHTLGVALLAAGIAMIVGGLLGAAIGLLSPFRILTNSSVDFLRSLPVIALIPVAILLWGPEFRTEVLVAVYAAIWPVLVNAAAGVQGVHPRLYEVANTFQLSRAERLRKIVLPVATPSVLVGGRLAVVTALVVAIVAEMLANPQGVGWGIMRAQQGLRAERMWAYAISSGTLGFLVNAALVFAVARALPGGVATRTRGD
jgi:ABC-type nitrate/sulfonate/bicarbonate transport system permease component